MALSISNLGTAVVNTNSGTKNLTATPGSAGRLIILYTGHTGYSGSTAPTDDQGGTYSLICTAVKASSGDKMEAWVRDQLSPSVSTVFSHAPGTTTGGFLVAQQVNNIIKTGTAAIKQSAVQDNQAAATPAPVLGAAAQTTNGMSGAVFNATSPAGMTEPSSWTESLDSGYSSPTTGIEVARRNSGETGTTITWGSSSASAFCSIVLEIDADGTLTPSLFTNSNSFYAATVSPGTVDLTPSLFSNSNSFYSPTVAPGAVTLTPSIFSNSETFYSPTVTADGGTQTLTPSLFTNTNTFYAPTVSPGEVTLTPSLLSDGDTFYAATVSPGAVSLTPSLFSNSGVFYSASVTAGAVDLAPALFADGDTFYSATVSPGAVTLTPGLFVNDNSFYSPTAAPGAVDLAPALFSDGDTFYSPTVTTDGATQTLTPDLFSNSNAFYAATVTPGTIDLSPSLLSDGDAFYSATISVGAVTLLPSIVANDNAFYALSVVGGDAARVATYGRPSFGIMSDRPVSVSSGARPASISTGRR